MERIFSENIARNRDVPASARLYDRLQRYREEGDIRKFWVFITSVAGASYLAEHDFPERPSRFHSSVLSFCFDLPASQPTHPCFHLFSNTEHRSPD
jgi:hypothetical protein